MVFFDCVLPPLPLIPLVMVLVVVVVVWYQSSSSSSSSTSSVPSFILLTNFARVVVLLLSLDSFHPLCLLSPHPPSCLPLSDLLL